jgi:hypothetical protein
MCIYRYEVCKAALILHSLLSVSTPFADGDSYFAHHLRDVMHAMFRHNGLER